MNASDLAGYIGTSRSPGIPFWTVLPPLQLRGMNGPYVESITFYVHRLAWVSGMPVNRLLATLDLENLGNRRRNTGNVIRLLLGKSDQRLSALEALTAMKDLERGSFWRFKHVESPYFLGLPAHYRRWCPECYRAWDDRDSYEPLIWSVGLLARCPVHRCAMESACRSCGSPQPLVRRVDDRRQCVRCRQSLGSRGYRPAGSSYVDWVDAQIACAVEFCAMPGQPPLSPDFFASNFARLFGCQGQGEGSPLIIQSIRRPSMAHHAPLKLSLRGLIRLCALQAVTLREILESEDQVAAVPSIAFSESYLLPALPIDVFHERAESALVFVRRLLNRSKEIYLPSLTSVLRPLSVNRALVRELNLALYERYEAHFRMQATPASLHRLERAFHCALSSISTLPPERLRHRLLWAMPSQIARDTRVTFNEAARALNGALVYSRLLYMTKRHRTSHSKPECVIPDANKVQSD